MGGFTGVVARLLALLRPLLTRSSPAGGGVPPGCPRGGADSIAPRIVYGSGGFGGRLVRPVVVRALKRAYSAFVLVAGRCAGGVLAGGGLIHAR